MCESYTFPRWLPQTHSGLQDDRCVPNLWVSEQPGLRDTQRGNALNVWQSGIALHMFGIRKINKCDEWDFPSRSQHKLCVSKGCAWLSLPHMAYRYTVVRIECVISIRNNGNEKEDKEFKRMRGARRGLLSFNCMIFVRCCCNTIIEHQQNTNRGSIHDERDAIAQ